MPPFMVQGYRGFKRAVACGLPEAADDGAIARMAWDGGVARRGGARWV
tara:strand:- start:10643 stop:10786 length:144 start_codon:yes stop_codon:yes gene_type:complete